MRILFIALFCVMPAYAGASASLLTGAETYFVKLNIHDESACRINREAIARLASREMGAVAKLRPVAEEAVPDMHMTVTVEASAMPSTVEATEACLYLINVRVIHPMFGQMRYGTVPRLIQALTFNKTVHGIIVPERLGEALVIQTSKALVLFLDEYRSGNGR